MADVNSTVPERAAGVLTALATAIVITAVAILPFLTPAWVSFEQGTGRGARTDRLHRGRAAHGDRRDPRRPGFGPPNFDVAVGGSPVLNERERAHMRDVRGVFAGFGLLARPGRDRGLLAAIALARRLGHAERAWAAIRNGAAAWPSVLLSRR